MLDREYLYEDGEKPPALFTARVRTGLVGLFFLIVFVRRQPSSISISISSASEIMLQSPSPVRIPLRGLARTPPRQYSKWRCVGNLEDINEFKYRTCLFEDVCYDTISSDFFFFAPSGNRSVPFIFDHQRGEQRKFRHRRAGGDELDVDFVALSKQTKYRAKSSLTWSPLVSHEPVPRHESTTVMLDGLHALTAPFVPTNLGHVAWDEAFPLLVAMAQLGEYSPTLRILRTHGCETLTESRSSRELCAKFQAAFLAPLLGERTAHVETLAQLAAAHRLPLHAQRPMPSRRMLCFQKLLVGGAFDAFNDDRLNLGKEPLLALYRARVLAWHGVPYNLSPRSHTILLVDKAGKRSIHNFRQVQRHVTERFGRMAKVEVTSYAGLTMAQQLSLVARTTVAVSPCGGISMILPFLPEGAHAILLNYMLGPRDFRRHGECAGCSWAMEAELWRHVRHVKKVYYQVWGEHDFARGRPGRDSAVKVDVARLEGLVAASLADMQP